MTGHPRATPAGRDDASPGTRAAAREFLAWARESRTFAIRVSALSLMLSVLAVMALALAHQAMGAGGGAAGLPFASLAANTAESILGPSYWLLALSIGAWLALLSLSHLVVVRSVRSYLAALGARDHQGRVRNLVADRELIETYLGILATAARSAAFAVSLMIALPVASALSVVVVMAVAGWLSYHRWSRGVTIERGFEKASRTWRTSRSDAAKDAFVDQIYARDAYVNRLPMPELGVLALLVLGGVVGPLWFTSDQGHASSLLILLAWLQALLATVTAGARLGWWWSRNSRGGGRRGRTDEDEDADEAE
ncbi:MAG: hypothetical protein GC156_03890 [Actinomycetales bacterium]|nr:hypothetical protein [Actinomycetales bacterium]